MGSHLHLARQQGPYLSNPHHQLAGLAGLFYAVFTGFLGFVPNSDEWKVMGLAPYGKPGVDLKMFLDLREVPFKVCSDRLVGSGGNPYGGWPVALGKPREPESDISTSFTKTSPTPSRTSVNPRC